MHLSPSENHRYLMSANVPSMRYNGANVKIWQNRLRRKVRQLLGAMPKDRCDLRVRSLWRREHEHGSIEKIAFTSEPKADVVAYLCLPKAAEPPYPVMICVQGHSTGMHNSIGVERDDNTRPLEIEGDRDYAIRCMKQGIAALCIEQRSFGERRELTQKEPYPGLCHDAAVHALMLGRTLIGERVYDVDRAIDYLYTRDDMDTKCIGVMGNSGGGTTSVFSAATLPRLTLAMPSCYFCSFEASIMSIRHCTCNFVPHLLEYAEMPDVLGLFAPKPVVVVAGKEDPIFPIKATRKAFRELKAIYKACDATDRCHLVVGDEGHRFYADKAWPVMMKEIRRLRCG